MFNNIFIILIIILHFLVDFIILIIEIILLSFYIKIQIKILLKKYYYFWKPKKLIYLKEYNELKIKS
jgi:hypothetical protein